MDKKIGYLKVITGPMFAGKTEELLRHVHRLQRTKKKYLVFKPQVDNRHTTSEVISHQKNKTEALIVNSRQEIKKYLHNDIETIFIDEIQFFPLEISSFLCNLTQQGYQIIVAGLDKNFRGEPFNETIKILLALADYVEKLTAICQVCQKEASFTQRIINGQPARYHDPLILVGGQEAYEARCGSCYVIKDKENMPNKQYNSLLRSKNTLIIIAGGSGTGKTTVENLLAQDPNIVKLVSTTTRPPRTGEKDGQDYYFISKETFQDELEKGRFLEHVIYDSNYYGVHGKVVDLILGTQNKHGIIIVDVAAESMEKMVEHMKKRGTSEPEILRRLIIAEKEEKFATEFDHILTIKENDLAATAQKIKENLSHEIDLEFQKPLEKETEKEEFLVNHRDLIIKKSLVAEYEKNYARSLEKSHTAENKRDWIFTLSYVVPSYSLPKFAPFFLFLFVKNNPSKPVFNTANSLIELANDTKKMAERLRIYPFGLSAQKQINDFLAEPERDDIQKNVLVSEPVESITLQKREEKKIAYAEHENLVENGLSTGQKQRADLNSILATSENKEIFIFDEADNALDEKNKKEFRQKIEKISKKRLDIETQLRKLIAEKKELKKKFLSKLKDLSKQEKENQ
ncbi:15743_t:CDS:2, partial [Cetraspora pellucida]